MARQKRPSGSDRQILQRWALGTVGALGLGALLVVGLTGCPANLEDPQRFEGGVVDTGPSVPSCLTTVFSAHCSSSVCHSPGMPGGALDLISPGVASRLINVSATHTDVDMDGGTTCVADKYVDTATPASSWLLLKLNGGQGTCGLAMPETPPPLTSTEMKCVTDWVAAVAADAGASTTGGSGGSGGAAMTSAGSGGMTASSGSGGASGSGGSSGSGGATTTGGSGGMSSGGTSSAGASSGGASGASSGGTGGTASAGTGGM